MPHQETAHKDRDTSDNQTGHQGNVHIGGFRECGGKIDMTTFLARASAMGLIHGMQIALGTRTEGILGIAIGQDIDPIRQGLDDRHGLVPTNTPGIMGQPKRQWLSNQSNGLTVLIVTLILFKLMQDKFGGNGRIVNMNRTRTIVHALKNIGLRLSKKGSEFQVGKGCFQELIDGCRSQDTGRLGNATVLLRLYQILDPFELRGGPIHDKGTLRGWRKGHGKPIFQLSLGRDIKHAGINVGGPFVWRIGGVSFWGEFRDIVGPTIVLRVVIGMIQSIFLFVVVVSRHGWCTVGSLATGRTEFVGKIGALRHGLNHVNDIAIKPDCRVAMLKGGYLVLVAAAGIAVVNAQKGSFLHHGKTQMVALQIRRGWLLLHDDDQEEEELSILLVWL